MTRHPAFILLVWLLKLGLGGLFLVAGIAKFSNPAAFAEEISNYQLFPQLASYAAATLPTVEILIGTVLIFGVRKSDWLHAAAFCAAGLMAMFTFAAGHVVNQHIDTSCGCFGGASSSVSTWTIVRDVLLLVAAILLLVLARAQTRQNRVETE